MTVSQLSIFVENKAGKLVEITEVLGRAGIDIRAMSIADTQDFGILRLIVSDAEKAKKVLTENGNIVSITKVTAVAVDDKPGALTEVIKLLSDNGVNIEYMYAFIIVSGKHSCVVLRVEDNDKAIKLLSEHGIKLVCEEDIKNL